MKRLMIILMFCSIFVIGQNCYGQGTAGQHDPYQNLTKYYIYNNDWNYDGVLPPQYVWHNEDDWYGTQAMPTSLEKAEWALNDINDYRTENGLEPLEERVLNQNYEYSEGSDWIFLLISVAMLWLFMLYVLYQIRDLAVYKDNTYMLFKYVEKGLKLSAKEVADVAFDKTFPVYWRSLDELRRRKNTGHFVQAFNREPSETEIITGEIKNED